MSDLIEIEEREEEILERLEFLHEEYERKLEQLWDAIQQMGEFNNA